MQTHLVSIKCAFVKKLGKYTSWSHMAKPNSAKPTKQISVRRDLFLREISELGEGLLSLLLYTVCRGHIFLHTQNVKNEIDGVLGMAILKLFFCVYSFFYETGRRFRHYHNPKYFVYIY